MSKIQMYPLHTRRKVLLSFVLLTVLKTAQCDITVSTQELPLQLNDFGQFSIIAANVGVENASLHIVIQHEDIIKIKPRDIVLLQNQTIYNFTVEATSAGHTEVSANSTNKNINLSNVFLRATVYKNKPLGVFSITIGWVYFIAWSVSFYPQIYINYKRKSVVGLNFDFLVLNLIGFALYSTFNLGLYTIPEVEKQYFERYPRGLNPVKVNDIVFAVHAFVATFVTIAQCFIYERGDQRVSIIARIILGIYAVFLTISLILSGVYVINWLDFLYYCSYVKLSITLIKYIPQAYMNYKRKSTVGWSIGNIILDFTGGVLSMLQMILDSYNYNDWVSIFGDPTKFGLGLFSVIFDVFFIIQHYFLYRNTNYEEIFTKSPLPQELNIL
ncbi:hypothetical protein RN001_012328 [Aquatica leii]|uniref:Cystinosin homolog n=1 Tax=Aquatica leii TaxID=1421715 RepID=A0AAN7P610_9COLE|nr:hypothetical protein RN001_012328 [Aquatica leii]